MKVVIRYTDEIIDVPFSIGDSLRLLGHYIADLKKISFTKVCFSKISTINRCTN